MILLESASECGAKGKTIQRAFQAEAGNKGFQPQSKPPVHTGGFDLICIVIEIALDEDNWRTFVSTSRC